LGAGYSFPVFDQYFPSHLQTGRVEIRLYFFEKAGDF
jgi:hypothetical protein